MESEFARALAALTTGIYVLTVSDGETHHGMSSSWVAQVSGVPPLFTAAVDSRHFSCDVVKRTGKFGLNVVGNRGRELEDYFYSARAASDRQSRHARLRIVTGSARTVAEAGDGVDRSASRADLCRRRPQYFRRRTRRSDGLARTIVH